MEAGFFSGDIYIRAVPIIISASTISALFSYIGISVIEYLKISAHRQWSISAYIDKNQYRYNPNLHTFSGTPIIILCHSKPQYICIGKHCYTNTELEYLLQFRSCRNVMLCLIDLYFVYWQIFHQFPKVETYYTALCNLLHWYMYIACYYHLHSRGIMHLVASISLSVTTLMLEPYDRWP